MTLGDSISSAVARPAKQQALLLQSMANGQGQRSGPGCGRWPFCARLPGLSLSNPQVTQDGKIRFRWIWRTLATQFPDFAERLAILAPLISEGEVSYLPTVTARDYRSPGDPQHERLQKARGLPLPEELGARISPEFAEWMMGFPEGWTDVSESRPSETPSSPKSSK